MSYFALALLALLTAQGLMAAGYGFPSTPLAAPETLILVHVAAIGWLSLLLCGALFQFVPVLIARQLYSDRLPLPTLACLVVGLVALVCGFLQLAGHVPPDVPCFPAAALLLSLGFTLAIWNLGRTLWAARPLSLPARFVVVGLFSLAATVALGVIFALTLGGTTAIAPFLDLTAAGLPIHAIAGLGGWLTFTAIGVSYRLLAMFMLAPENEGRTTRGALAFGTAALAVAILGGTAAICHAIEPAHSLAIILIVAGALGLAALALYGHDIAHLYRARRRRRIELNSRMAAVAIGNLAAAAIGLAVLTGIGALERFVGAVVFFVSFGWLTGLGLAKLYKIVAFLTWLECYGPVLGKTPTPRVQDLVAEPHADKWFMLYFAATWAATLALLLEFPSAFRIAAAVMMIATAGIIVQIARTRRLANVATDRRLPAGAQMPRLLFSSPKST
jgi:hypothetical protein